MIIILKKQQKNSPLQQQQKTSLTKSFKNPNCIISKARPLSVFTIICTPVTIQKQRKTTNPATSLSLPFIRSALIPTVASTLAAFYLLRRLLFDPINPTIPPKQSAMDSLQHLIRSSPILYNIILLSPLLILSFLISYIYTNRTYLRTGETTVQQLPPVVDLPPPLIDNNAQIERREGEGEEEEEEYPDPTDDLEEERLREFLREAGMDPDAFDNEDDGDDGSTQAGSQFGGGGIENGVGVGNGGEGGVGRREDINPPPTAPRNSTTRRTGIVGKKKARNLENRDRRRAYFEFLRTQQRERILESEAKEAAVSAEIFEAKQRRALAEEEIERKRREEIEKRRAEEAFRKKLRNYLLDGVEVGGKIDMGGLCKDAKRDKEWIVKFLREERIVGVVREDKKGDGYYGLLTDGGRWFVKIGRGQVEELIGELDSEGGIMTIERVGEVLEGSLRSGGAKFVG